MQNAKTFLLRLWWDKLKMEIIRDMQVDLFVFHFEIGRARFFLNYVIVYWSYSICVYQYFNQTK